MRGDATGQVLRDGASVGFGDDGAQGAGVFHCPLNGRQPGVQQGRGRGQPVQSVLRQQDGSEQRGDPFVLAMGTPVPEGHLILAALRHRAGHGRPGVAGSIGVVKRDLLVHHGFPQVVEQGAGKAGVGPQILLTGLLFRAGVRRQQDTASQQKGVVGHFQAVAQQTTWPSVVVGL